MLAQVRAADGNAWRLLVQLYSPLVYSHCRRARLSPEDSRDIVQEVFRVVHCSLDGFRRDRPGSFRKWLSTVTQNLVVDFFRRCEREPQAIGGTDAQRQWLEMQTPEQATSVSSPTDRVFKGRFQPLFASVRGEFADDTWHAFWRSVVRGEPIRQIAEDLGKTENAVRKAKYRVLRRLRDDFDHFMGAAE